MGRLAKAKVIHRATRKPTKQSLKVYSDYQARGEAAYAGLDD